MTIGFFHVETDTLASEQGYLCAKAMMKSARNVMPGVPIVHFTDLESQAVKGVDDVRRKPAEPMGLLRIRHCACVDGDWLFVDTDVWFQKSVRRIFKKDFDIAVTTRDWTHVKQAGGFTERMPFNTGVVFSRCPRFWAEVYTRLRWLDGEQQEWMGEQQVICDVASETDRYVVKRLRGRHYNFPPEVPGALPSSAQLEAEASILHYKGSARKDLLLSRLKDRRCA